MSRQYYVAFSDDADYTNMASGPEATTTSYVNGPTLPVPKGAELAEIILACDGAVADSVISMKVETSPNASVWSPVPMLGNTVAGVTEVEADILESVFREPAPVDQEACSFQISVLTANYLRLKLKGDVGGTPVKAYVVFFGQQLKDANYPA